MWFQYFAILFLFFCILSISESLKCYACRHSLRNKDVLDGIDSNPECMSFEKFYNNSAYIRTCGTKEIQCMSQVTNMNGFFVEIKRDCASYCKPVCYEKGYGLSLTICTRCCNSEFCNNFDGRKYFLPNLAFKNNCLNCLTLILSVIIYVIKIL